MKDKIYLLNYIVSSKNYQPIIIINYNKYIFFINNDIYKA